MDIQPTTTPLTPEQADLRELVIRLARVQAKIIDPVKLTAGDANFNKRLRDGSVKEYRFADLVTVLQTVRPALANEGIVVTQPFDSTASEIRVLTQLRYGIACIESVWLQPMPPMPVSKAGEPLPMGQAQKIGACATYARRKALLALVGVQDDEQDDPDLGTREQTPEPSEREKRIKEQANARAQQQEHQEDDLGPLMAQTLRMLGDMAVRNDYAIDKRAALQACLDKRGWPEPTRERLESLQAALLDPSKEEALMKIIKPHLSQRQTQREATQVEVERAAAAWAEANMMHNVVEDYYVRDMITALATDLGQDLGAMTPKAWAVQLARFQDPKQTPTLQALFAGVFVPF